MRRQRRDFEWAGGATRAPGRQRYDELRRAISALGAGSRGVGVRDGRGLHCAVAERASVVRHEGVAVTAVGKQEASAHGRPLLLRLRVGRGLEGRVLVEESLDATRASVPVE
jgi:hypothetical protein